MQQLQDLVAHPGGGGAGFGLGRFVVPLNIGLANSRYQSQNTS